MKPPRINSAWVIALFMLAPAAMPVRAAQPAPVNPLPTESGQQKPAEKPDRPAAVYDVKLLSPQRAQRLDAKAREEYDKGVGALDKVLYEPALEHFTAAIQTEPDNVYLRFVAVQLAQYLGQTRMGDEAIKFYDIAIDNLKTMADSSKLNAREKERARSALETVTALRQTVTERDAQRRLYGDEMAKVIAQDRFKEKEQAKKEKKAKEQAQMKSQFKEQMRQAGRFNPGTANGEQKEGEAKPQQ